MSYAMFWIIFSGVCLITEIFTAGFLLFFPGIGALIACIAALLGANITIQIILFAVSTTLMILLLRPIIAKVFKADKHTPTNSDALVGRRGVVLKKISGKLGVGQIKVSGEIWSAISDSDKPINVDSEVIVEKIIGVKLLVSEVEKN